MHTEIDSKIILNPESKQLILLHRLFLNIYIYISLALFPVYCQLLSGTLSRLALDL